MITAESDVLTVHKSAACEQNRQIGIVVRIGVPTVALFQVALLLRERTSGIGQDAPDHGYPVGD